MCIKEWPPIDCAMVFVQAGCQVYTSAVELTLDVRSTATSPKAAIVYGMYTECDDVLGSSHATLRSQCNMADVMPWMTEKLGLPEPAYI